MAWLSSSLSTWVTWLVDVDFDDVDDRYRVGAGLGKTELFALFAITPVIDIGQRGKVGTGEVRVELDRQPTWQSTWLELGVDVAWLVLGAVELTWVREVSVHGCRCSGGLVAS